MRLSGGRLLFQPPFYQLDPTLVAQPLILISFVLLILFANRLRQDVRVQFLWGATLLPLALLFNPYTARILGEMLTPWQLWRMTWGLPAAFVITEALWSWQGLAFTRWSPKAVSLALILLLVGSVGLSSINPARAVWAARNNQELDPDTQA